MRVGMAAASALVLSLFLGVEAQATDGPSPASGSAQPAQSGAASASSSSPIAAASPAPGAAGEKVANVEPAKADAPEIITPKESLLGTALKDQLAIPAAKMPDADKADRAALAAFYEARSQEPLWVEKTGLSAKGVAVASEIGRAADWGLEASEFRLTDIPSAASANSSEIEKSKLADAELRLSLAILKYARHARGGRIADPTSMLSSYLDRKPQLLEPKQVLEDIAKAADPDAFLRKLHPQHAEFDRLRKQLLEIRDTDAARAAVKVPAAGPKLAPGIGHADVAIVRKRLKVAAPMRDGKEDDTYYDDALAAAVKEFQAANGIKPANGIIGGGTRAALNKSEPTISVRKLLANMEQWRWMPADLGELYVWVNIPEFMVRVVKNGEVIHAERVITGKTDTQTPIFSDSMETVVFHPFWGVPESIKVKELWPGLVRGGNSLARNGLRLQRGGRDVDPASVDWTTADIRNFHVYQPPGGGNVLGVVKFLFPNKHQVYMHDTPTKNLFNSTQRTFSHGCMRVRNPVRLAEVLLGEDKGWDAGRISGLIKGGPQNNEIALQKKVPVHVTYFTARADGEGKVQAFNDFYGHEQRINLALDGKWTQIARGRDHLAPVRAEPISRLAEGRAGAQPSTALGDFFKNLFGGF